MQRTIRWAALMSWVGIVPCGLARASGLDGLTGAPQVTTLIDGAEMPNTERTATVGRRIFVTSGLNLFEVVRPRRGGYERISIAEASVTLPDGQVAPAMFLGVAAHGRVLYATATAVDASRVPYASALYRIELGQRSGEVTEVATAPFVGHEPPFMPNGMAVDWRGHVFIANSYSATTGEAAILELEVTRAPFSFEETVWLSASDGGAFPNGVRLTRDTLYLSSLSNLLQVAIERDATAGAVSTLYAASADDFLDDFAVVPGALIVCEIDNPFAAPDSPTSQLTIVSRSGLNPGELLGSVSLAEAGILPSSVTPFWGGIFGKGSLLVTDYFGGGLYAIGF